MTGSAGSTGVLGRAWRWVVSLFFLLMRALRWLRHTLLGDVTWTAPLWMRVVGTGTTQLGDSARRHPKRALLTAAVLIAVLGASWFGQRWWAARPKPVPVTIAVEAPARTEIEAPLAPARLPKRAVLTFSASVAPLAAVGKDVTTGIEMTPAVAGIWHWENDRTLAFTPKFDWPAGTRYQVRLKPALLAKDVLLADAEPVFSSAAFGVKITQSQFYQDPVVPEVKQALFDFAFTHPVNPAEFLPLVTLKQAGQGDGVLGFGKETTRFTVTWDTLKLHATVRSVSLPIPKEPSTLALVLAPGLKPARGGAAEIAELRQDVAVPGLNSLAVTTVTPQVVTNDKNESEHVLTLATSALVHERNVAKATHAWILPRFNAAHMPARPDETAPYAWSVNEVTPAVLAQSTPVTLGAIPAEREHADQHSFKYQGEPGRRLYLRVDAGVTSFGGYLLPKAQHHLVQVPAFPSELKILGQGALLAMSGERKIAVLARDVPGIKIELGRVLPAQLQHLVSQSSGNLADPQFTSTLGPDNLTERIEIKLPTPVLAPGAAHYEAVELGQFLKSDADVAGRRGLFLLTVSNYDPAADAANAGHRARAVRRPGEAPESGRQTPVGAVPDCFEPCSGTPGARPAVATNPAALPAGPRRVYDGLQHVEKRLLLVTDLGILVKKSMDGSQDVFVQSIVSGAPVAGATVEVIAKNGATVATQVTDATGHVRLPNIDGLARERAPLMVLARKGGDMSFLPLNRADRALDMSRFDVGGARNAAVADQLSSYLFSDRGIYRPGDTMHIGMIVKPANWGTPISGLPLEAEVIDARGLTVKREKMVLPAGGFMELTHTTQETSPTGAYTINLYLMRDGYASAQIGTTSVKVQEFQPDRMKLTAGLSTQAVTGWVSPKDLKVLVNAQNLFGTPAENRRVTGEITLSPAFPAFAAFPDYRFYDPQRAKEGFTEKVKDQTTNAQGDAEFALDLEKYAKATYRLHFLARGFEAQGGRGVSAEAVALVSDLPYLVGFKADGALDYVSRGARRNVSIIAINAQGVKSAAEGMTLQHIERKTVSVLTRQKNDTYKYESRKKDILLEQSPLALAAGGLVLPLATDTPGDFTYVLRDAQGLEMNRIDYAVAGKGNITRSLERSAELQLTLNKKDYVPGEEIEVSIKAPYTGAGLITIERDKVFHHEWFRTDTLASVQKIRLPRNFEGTGYVSVQFIRDPASDEIFTSPLSYGVAPFATSLAARTNALSIQAPTLVKPGMPLSIKVTAAQPSRVAIFAVDEGILQVARYQKPDPLGTFFQKRMLEVKTAQILDLILPEFKKLMAASAPGGDGDGAMGKHLNPFKRKTDKPAAYWSGIIDVKDSREVTYVVPETFNGAMRIMAVAVNDATVGVAQASTTVRGDFVLSPNAPLVVSPGDEFDVSVGLSNNVAGSGVAAPVALTVTTSPHLAVVGNATQTIKVAEQREGVAVFRFRAQDAAQGQLGSATLRFTAALGTKSATLGTEVSVRPAVERRMQVSVGSFTGSATVPVTRDMYAQGRMLEAGVSKVPLVLAAGLSSYLAGVEYQCTEQLISQAIPAIILGARPDFANPARPVPQARSLEQALQVLRTRQNAEGGFGLWNASVAADEFASVYAVHMLLEAREKGMKVPPDMLQNGLGYASRLAASPGTTLPELRARAYAAYLLTRQQVVSTPALTAIRESLESRFPKVWETDLAAAYLASAYQLQKQDVQAARLMDRQVAQLGNRPPGAAYADYYDPLIGQAQTVYLLSRHFPSRLGSLPASVMTGMLTSIAAQQYNTLSSAYLILAFDAYATAIGPQALGKLGVAQIDAAGKSVALPLPGVAVPRVPFAPGTTHLTFSSDSPTATYYAVTESGYDRKAPGTALTQGMEVLREYLGADGKPVSSVTVGEEITVRLALRAVGRPSINNVAVIDLLPGGFEAVIDNVAPAERQAGSQTPGNAATEGPDGQPEDSGEGEGQTNGDAGVAQTEAPTTAQRSALGGLSRGSASMAVAQVDVREDRVLIYTSATNSIGEIRYRIKATTSGRFQIPPAYAESMYERTVQARSVGGQTMVVAPAGVVK